MNPSTSADGRTALRGAAVSTVGSQPATEGPCILVVAGPSGAGKGTLVQRLRSLRPQRFGFSISHTSRQPRAGEQHGVHYYFESKEHIEKMRDSGLLLEHAMVHGNMYATSNGEVERLVGEGRACILEIDLRGYEQVLASPFAAKTVGVFVEPPSKEALEKRLRGRGSESEEAVALRLLNAVEEMEKARKLPFDLMLTNDSLEAAVDEFVAFCDRCFSGGAPAAAPTAEDDKEGSK
eukprot:GHVU01031480.1.p1 GENE.GHVU01031480.1~~GHVU01031480.1.p1  ORF type:complete len:236 (+),score=60.69 GHVU01031480.1:448-1155(+)